MRVLAAALVCVALLAGCASLEQKESEVYRRTSGGRLQPWLSLAQASALHWPFAWAAVAAYQDADDPKRDPLETSASCPEPHRFLASQGWELWEELPLLRQPDSPGSLGRTMREAHLRAEVWASRRQGQVIVAFGGTVPAYLEDWKANFRWLLSPLGARDAYDVLSEGFVPAFAAAWQARAARPEGAWLKDAQLVGAGHSLGGGLAQRFAYTVNVRGQLPRVREVYAFNPSPVSGKRGIDGWREALDGLTIHRIYNRGEILASLRAIFRVNEDPTPQDGRTWIDIRYHDNWSWKTLLPAGWVQAHGMWHLACFMKAALPLP